VTIAEITQVSDPVTMVTVVSYIIFKIVKEAKSEPNREKLNGYHEDARRSRQALLSGVENLVKSSESLGNKMGELVSVTRLHSELNRRDNEDRKNEYIVLKTKLEKIQEDLK